MTNYCNEAVCQGCRNKTHKEEFRGGYVCSDCGGVTQKGKELRGVILLAVILALIMANMYLSAVHLKKQEEVGKLKAQVEHIKLCGLDVVVCEDEEMPPEDAIMTTQASWYDYSLNGVEWSKNHRTTASREFERGTLIEVTNIENGKSVIVMVNDYGPDESVHPDRALDLSSYAFGLIANKKHGLVTVQYRVIGKSKEYKKI